MITVSHQIESIIREIEITKKKKKKGPNGNSEVEKHNN